MLYALRSTSTDLYANMQHMDKPPCEAGAKACALCGTRVGGGEQVR